MSAKRIMRHQLLRDGPCERRLKAALDIDGGEFSLLAGLIVGQLGSLKRKIGAFGVNLGTDGYVLAGSH